MKNAEHILSKFPSSAALQRALGHKNPTTIQGWRERGRIPAKQQLAVMRAGKAMGINITPADFFEGEEE